MIEIESLYKTFKVSKRKAGIRSAVKSLFNPNFTTVNALEDVSFKINEGKIVSYIGPNGVGKSNTIKIISGSLVLKIINL